jgi:hypothetical protein
MGALTKDVIESWLGYKREKEVDAIALRPIPMNSIFISTFRSDPKAVRASPGCTMTPPRRIGTLTVPAPHRSGQAKLSS